MREIAPDQAYSFLEINHRSGNADRRLKGVRLGLFLGEELLAVAQFCYPRTAGKQRVYSVELLRLAFKTEVRVRGGASKLLAHYRREHRPPDIFTYQDMRGEATDVYKHCGFTLVSQAKTKKYLVAPKRTLATAQRGEYYSYAEAVRRGPDALLGTSLGEVFRPSGERKNNPELFLEELGWHDEETPGDRVYEWVSPDFTYYTYRVTASDSNKYYFGVSHVKKKDATQTDCLQDGYFGSGGLRRDNKFRNWKAKHAASLQKQVFNVFSRKAEAYAHENELVGDLWRTDRLCLNSCPGGRRGGNAVVMAKFPTHLAECKTHGATKFRGDTCCRCVAESEVKLLSCSIHGVTAHRGLYCYRCENSRSLKLLLCEAHGETYHRGSSCLRCSASQSYSTKNCEVHGQTKFRGDQCQRCLSVSQKTLRACPVHGLVKHQGASCYTCEQQRTVYIRNCPLHGDTKHQGKTCSKCSSDRTVTVATCSTHGETKFHGAYCYQCETDARLVRGNCRTHGEVVLYGGRTCAKCANEKRDSFKVCAIHGESKHAGDRCRRCAAEKTAHTRFHTDSRLGCVYCEVTSGNI